MQVLELALEVRLRSPPRQPVHAGSGVPLEIDRTPSSSKSTLTWWRSAVNFSFFLCLAACRTRSRPVTRLPGPAPGACFSGPRSPWSPPLAPPAPPRIAPLCSSASQLLWRGLTSPARSSSATAPRLPDADRRRAPPRIGREISRFPCKERPHMPGSATTPGWPGARDSALVMSPSAGYSVGARDSVPFAAQWLAYALPCRRFAAALAGGAHGSGSMRFATPSS